VRRSRDDAIADRGVMPGAAHVVPSERIATNQRIADGEPADALAQESARSRLPLHVRVTIFAKSTDCLVAHRWGAGGAAADGRRRVPMPRRSDKVPDHRDAP